MNDKTLAEICLESYNHATFNINECEVIIKYFDDVQVVAFRGTEAGALFSGAGFIDVIRDMRVTPWYDKDAGWVHSGFLKGAQGAVEFLADRLVKDLPIVCTGHSLGGALALMAAVKLHAIGFVIRTWVGFGSPKCQLTKKSYPFNQLNYRYKADIVPMMPRLPFYRHNGFFVTLNAQPDRVSTWDDHGIQLYIDALY